MNVKTRLRIEQLKQMDKLLYTCNNINLLGAWYTNGVPNCAERNDYISIAESDERYNECIAVFKKIVNNDEFYI